MARNTPHEMLSTLSADTEARQRFVLALKRQTEPLRRSARTIFNKRSGENTTDENLSETAIMSALYKDDLYQTIATLKHIGQKRMWGTISLALEANEKRLRDNYLRFTNAPNRLGSLTLNPEINIPQEFESVHVHLQPGGYLADKDGADILAGAYYEEGGALYSRGQSVGTRESKAEMLIRLIRSWKPNFNPTKILDLACSAGASSVPYAQAYPDATVDAIDVAPAMLRYAHARAESIGVPVHFHQMNVVNTTFADESFDLIISHNALHEMSNETQQGMISESYRLLKPGGLCLHQDLPLNFSHYDAFDRVEKSYDKWFNGELYWSDYAESDFKAMFKTAGFDIDHGLFDLVEQSDQTMKWFVAAAAK